MSAKSIFSNYILRLIFSFGVPSALLTKKDIAFGTAHKKDIAFGDVFFGCPDGLEPSTFRTTI